MVAVLEHCKLANKIRQIVVWPRGSKYLPCHLGLNQLQQFNWETARHVYSADYHSLRILGNTDSNSGPLQENAQEQKL